MRGSRPQASFVRWFDGIGIDDIPVVGGKNASLCEMYRARGAKGVKMPNGFAITADAYRGFRRESVLDHRIHDALGDVRTQDVENRTSI